MARGVRFVVSGGRVTHTDEPAADCPCRRCFRYYRELYEEWRRDYARALRRRAHPPSFPAELTEEVLARVAPRNRRKTA